MSPLMRKGLAVAAIHLAIVSSLGAKLIVDRATRPRVWARTAPVDPNLPIRGRYVSLRLEAVPDPGEDRPVPQMPADPSGATLPLSRDAATWGVVFSVRDGQLLARSSSDSSVLARNTERNGRAVVLIEQPLAYFIPEHAVDPSRRPAGEELWVEVTVPRHGAPRPIRLGVKKDGILTPLDLR